MDIPNLSTQTTPTSTPKNDSFSLPLVVATILVSLAAGYWFSRFYPLNGNTVTSSGTMSTSEKSTDNISNADQLKVGVVYGNKDPNCKDTATGSIEKGAINGEGTHILNRPGGSDQRASLTSATVDLDLFVGKKVEITGQTNSSKKTGWLLDVCSVKITE